MASSEEAVGVEGTDVMTPPPTTGEEAPAGAGEGRKSSTVNFGFAAGEAFGLEAGSLVPLAEHASQLPLTKAQIDAISSAFRAAVQDHGSEDGSVPSSEAERLAANIFGTPLTDQMLDVIIEKTERHDRLDHDLFLNIIVAVMAASTRWGNLQTRLEGKPGFAAIGKQLHGKLLKRGFELNLMVVGESGLGKSTLIDTLFSGKVSRRSCAEGEFEELRSTIEIGSMTHVVEEDGVRMKLTVVDTPGFGDAVDNTDCWNYVLEYIELQHSHYLDAEIAVDRPSVIPDSRIHACLYFIAPSGHGLTQLDMAAMRALQHAVNIIPVIAKADTLTPDEIADFKAKIREDMDAAGIQPYPQPRDGDDEEDALSTVRIREAMPFAVVGRNYEKKEDGVLKMYRRTRCGLVDVESHDHCDFAALRDVVLRSRTQDLKEVTAQVLYEAYRKRNLVQGGEGGN